MKFKTVKLYNDYNPSAAPQEYVLGTYWTKNHKTELALPTQPSEWVWCANKIDWARVSVSEVGVWFLTTEEQIRLFEDGELPCAVHGGALTLEREEEEEAELSK